uniref:lysozyme n=1 Tax=Myoviridae sp. ctuev19 TaxID=2827716 RepID=A0A8S5SF18_9CAUD|nr:MAG TPA: endolysin [Myoviridae sp. ctuev19]
MTGIDVSKHQGMIAWSKVKTDFAILRAGFGRYAYQKDPMFERNYAGAKAAGIPVGAYWYSYAKSAEEAREEAKACLQVLKGKRFEFPIYFDIEDSTQGNLSKAVLTTMCEAFCDSLEKAGYFAGVYASTYWFTHKLDHARLAGKYTIWLADYRKYYDRDLKRDMHQYTSNGHVDGISGRVDMNTCTRDFTGIIKKAGLNGFGEAAPVLRDITIKQASDGDINDFKALAERKELKYEIK